MSESTGAVLIASSSARDTDYAAWLDDDWTVTTVEDRDELVEAVRPDVALVLLGRDLIDGDPESCSTTSERWGSIARSSG
ncbi:hypothetical protein ACFR9U_09980 [Halorientalis brevis]|uniref:Uncharacterized protein n=1 Tax=Halorientalis brevis TaxID=1126241 RepID=A0ABD6CBY3_9EURY|nr:hypothetical protein [Halorientalis brevis]